MANTDDLLNQALAIRDAEQDGENTALRVGTLLIGLVQSLQGMLPADEFQEAMEAMLPELNRLFAGISQGSVDRLTRGVIVLKSMGSTLDNVDGGDYSPTYEAGDIRFTGTALQLVTEGGAEDYTIRPTAFYVNAHTLRLYKWNGSAMVELGPDTDKPVVIDYLNAPMFSEMAIGNVYYLDTDHKLHMKTSDSTQVRFPINPNCIYADRASGTTVIWNSTTSTWQQVGGGDVEVINSLGSTETRKPLSAKMGHDLLVLIQQIYNSLGNAAFWGAKPEIDWSSAGLTTHNITRSLGGHASSSSSATSVAEGARLTETITFDAGWMKSSLTVKMNDVFVPQYISGNTIDIPSVTGPVVITATAVQGTTVALTLNGGLHCADSNGNTIPNPTAATSGEPLSFEVWPDKWWQVPVLAAANDAKMTGGSLLLESITRQVTGQSTWDANGVETQNQTVTAYGLRVTAKNGSSNEVTGAITLKLTAKDVIQVGEFFAGSSSGNDGSLQYNNPALCRTACYIPLINANTVWWRWGSSAGANRFATAFYPATGHDTQGNNGWCNDQGSEKSYPTSGDMSERPYARCTFVVDEIASGYFEQVTSGTARQRLFTPAPYYYAKLANS